MHRFTLRGLTALGALMLLVAVITACGSGAATEIGDASAEYEPIPPKLALPLEGQPARRAQLAAIEGKPAPPLEVASWANVRGYSLESLKGQVVLLDFWGVWCRPCLELTPVIKRLHEKYSERGLVVIGVHTYRKAFEGRNYVKKAGIPYAVAFDSPGDPTAEQNYMVDGWPDLHLIDHRGILRYADVSNRATPAQFESAIEALLAERDRDLSE